MGNDIPQLPAGLDPRYIQRIDEEKQRYLNDQKKINAYSTDVKTLSAQVSALRTQSTIDKETINALQAKLSAQSGIASQAQAISNHNEVLKQQLSVQSQTIDNQKGQMGNLQSTLQKLEFDNQQVNTYINQLQVKINENQLLTNQKIQLEQGFIQVYQQLDNQKQNNQQLVTQLQQLQLQNQELINQNQGLQQQTLVQQQQIDSHDYEQKQQELKFNIVNNQQQINNSLLGQFKTQLERQQYDLLETKLKNSQANQLNEVLASKVIAQNTLVNPGSTIGGYGNPNTIANSSFLQPTIINQISPLNPFNNTVNPIHNSPVVNAALGLNQSLPTQQLQHQQLPPGNSILYPQVTQGTLYGSQLK